MHHFFVKPEQIEGRLVRITGPDVNHGRQVLRLKEGENLLISDGAGRDYVCAVKALEKDCITAGILREDEENRELPAAITLYQGLPKQDKMELIIQKAVELGVYSIVPVAAKRCVVKLDAGKAAARRARWQNIAQAAAKQSRRAVIPEVTEVRDFAGAVKAASAMEVKLIPYELAEDMSRTRRILENLRPGQDVAVFIGPEGGFAEEEIALALEGGLEPVTLGRRILRTETAGLTVLSWMVYLLET